MINIFIPVLFMCMSGDCSFMQAEHAFKTEAACRQSVDTQMAYMVEAANDAKQKFDVLEGTCVLVKIEKPSVQV